jgi:enterochelin esterase-like enzyme
VRQPHLGYVATSLAVILAAGCVPATPTSPTPTPVCSEDGRVEQTRIESPTLGWPIDVEYYLPPCYNQHTWAFYPVLYLIPGRGGSMTAWNSAGAARVANEMILRGEVPPFILVSTSNYSSDAHGQALLDDLVPYIDETFRTLAERRYRAVGGASMGGVIAYRMAFQHPDLFGSLGIFGSGVVGGDEGNVRNWIAAAPAEQRPRVLLDCGEGDTAMLRNAEKTVGILEEWDTAYTFNSEPGAHTYAYWSSNLELYYKWYAEDW